jgi:transposase InsO family protein
MQGFLNTRKSTSNEQWVYSGNKLFSHVEAVGTFRLILKTGYVLDLENVFFIPCFFRNLISVSKLDVIGFSF